MPDEPLRLAAPQVNLQTPPPDIRHNTYKLFVSKPDDLVGLVAYSLYKQQKIDFLQRHRDENKGAPPAQDIVDIFCSTFRDPNQVGMLRDRAEALLENVTEVLLNERESRIKKVYINELVRQLKEGPSWVKVAFQGVLGNLVTAALVAFVLFGASSSKIGVIPTLADWAGYNVSEKPPEPSAATPKAPPAPGQPTTPGG